MAFNQWCQWMKEEKGDTRQSPFMPKVNDAECLKEYLTLTVASGSNRVTDWTCAQWASSIPKTFKVLGMLCRAIDCLKDASAKIAEEPV